MKFGYNLPPTYSFFAFVADARKRVFQLRSNTSYTQNTNKSEQEEYTLWQELSNLLIEIHMNLIVVCSNILFIIIT